MRSGTHPDTSDAPSTTAPPAELEAAAKPAQPRTAAERRPDGGRDWAQDRRSPAPPTVRGGAAPPVQPTAPPRPPRRPRPGGRSHALLVATARVLSGKHRALLASLAAVVTVVVIALVAAAIAGGPDSSRTLEGPLVLAATGSTDRVTPGVAGGGLAPTPAASLIQPSQAEWTALLPLLEQSAAADPGDEYAQRRLALAYYNLGRPAEAAAIYTRLLAAGEDPVLRNRLGNTLRDSGDLAGAEAAYRAAIAQAPALAAAYLNLAEVLWRQGKDAEALAAIDQGLAAVAAQDRAALERARTVLMGSTTSPAP